MNLHESAGKLPAGKRERVLEALDIAENVSADKTVLDEIEVR